LHLGENDTVRDYFHFGESLTVRFGQNESRNDLIFDDVVQALEEKRSPIVLTERKDHLLYLEKRFAGFVKNIAVLRGGMSAAERRQCENALGVPDTEERLILATGRYIGEGFDDARLDTLFLTMPISWKGTLAQYVGRLHRQRVGKTNVLVVDYVDGAVPVLGRMAARRRAGYRGLGYLVTWLNSSAHPHSIVKTSRSSPEPYPCGVIRGSLGKYVR